jgi:hypothetical protein
MRRLRQNFADVRPLVNGFTVCIVKQQKAACVPKRIRVVPPAEIACERFESSCGRVFSKRFPVEVYHTDKPGTTAGLCTTHPDRGRASEGVACLGLASNFEVVVTRTLIVGSKKRAVRTQFLLVFGTFQRYLEAMGHIFSRLDSSCLFFAHVPRVPRLPRKLFISNMRRPLYASLGRCCL